jgi:hypothetical protein
MRTPAFRPAAVNRRPRVGFSNRPPARLQHSMEGGTVAILYLWGGAKRCAGARQQAGGMAPQSPATAGGPIPDLRKAARWRCRRGGGGANSRAWAAGRGPRNRSARRWLTPARVENRARVRQRSVSLQQPSYQTAWVRLPKLPSTRAAKGFFCSQGKGNRMEDAILVAPMLSMVLCLSAAETVPRFEWRRRHNTPTLPAANATHRVGE